MINLNIQPVVWALIDERPGTGNQTLAVAKLLDLPFEEKNLHWTHFAELPNLLIGASLRGLTESSKSEIKTPWPDLVIAAGRRAGSVARYIKKQSLDDCSLVQIMNPGESTIRDFDLVAVPNHDGVLNSNPNIIRTTGAPHGIENGSLSEARVHWHTKFSDFKKPL
ncbi:MAG TPA: ELM1/GtrOC1 family putative glycosyltransferase, partial [Rhodospirillales bacterium]|nr:ELM1/GtrOC1 family putative glycosyltransferase [Rhodospirillales bacterium]